MFTLSVDSWICLLSALGFNTEFSRPIRWSVFSYSRRNVDFLTLPFSIHLPPIIFFRFLFHSKTVNGYSWNNSHRFWLVLRMFQFFQTTAVSFGKNQLYVNINGIRFVSYCSCPFSCNARFHTNEFLIVALLQNLSFSSLEWWSKSFF